MLFVSLSDLVLWTVLAGLFLLVEGWFHHLHYQSCLHQVGVRRFSIAAVLHYISLLTSSTLISKTAPTLRMWLHSQRHEHFGSIRTIYRPPRN